MATATEPSIEQRLAAAEAAIVEIRRQLPATAKTHWLHQIAGILEDEPEFEKVLAFGHAYRVADRPPQGDPS